MLLITVTGRRSGRRYTIPVGYQRDGDVVTVMVSEARHKNWWRNYLDPGVVDLLLQGRALRGRAAVLAPGSEQFRAQAERTLRRIPGMGRVFRIDYDRRTGLTASQVEQLGEEIAIVQIRLLEPGTT